MLPDDFMAYRMAKITSKLKHIEAIKKQYVKQLLLIKETVDDCKDIIHQKYDLTEMPVKRYFDIKDDLLRK